VVPDAKIGRADRLSSKSHHTLEEKYNVIEEWT